MRVIICGVTELGRYVANNLYNGISVSVKPIAFVDNNSNLYGMLVDGIPVISYEELSKKEKVEEIISIIAVKSSKSVFQIVGQLEQMHVNNIGVVKPRVITSKSVINIQGDNQEIIWRSFEGREDHIIPRIETNLIDACNLKCRGCSHFSSIYSKGSYYLIDDFKRDLIQLRRVGKLVRLRLLGGEPFLLENMDEYVDVARAIFTETDIEIVTNGLLIPNVNEKIMRSIKKNDVGIVISPYRPTIENKNQILEKIEKYGIWWKFEGNKEITHFIRNLTLDKTHNPENSSKVCLAAGCTFLRKHKIYKCPFEALVKDLCQYYGLDFKHEAGIDIFEDFDKLYDSIIDYALKPVEMCQYCVESPELIPWSVNAKPILQEWLYNAEQD